jgi:hypothetical protein
MPPQFAASFISSKREVAYWHFSDIAGCPTQVRNAIISRHRGFFVFAASSPDVLQVSESTQRGVTGAPGPYPSIASDVEA